SRRRHTRFSRDWSSDVCSSDVANWVLSGRQVPVQPSMQRFNKTLAHAGVDTQVPPVLARKPCALDRILLGHDQWLTVIEGCEAVLIVLGVVGKGMDFGHEAEVLKRLAETVGVTYTSHCLHPRRRTPGTGHDL